MSPPIISDHVMSHDGLLQQILNPLSNSVSCDRRGTFGMFASAIFYLLVTSSRERASPGRKRD